MVQENEHSDGGQQQHQRYSAFPLRRPIDIFIINNAFRIASNSFGGNGKAASKQLYARLTLHFYDIYITLSSSYSNLI